MTKPHNSLYTGNSLDYISSFLKHACHFKTPAKETSHNFGMFVSKSRTKYLATLMKFNYRLFWFVVGIKY